MYDYLDYFSSHNNFVMIKTGFMKYCLDYKQKLKINTYIAHNQ
jgi:hypothetical protein